MTMRSCLDTAFRHSVITKEERDILIKRWEDITSSKSGAEARAQMIKELETEAQHRERAAMLTHMAIETITQTIENYRNARGLVDKGEAFIALHENFGRIGGFVQDAEGRRDAIIRETHARMAQVMKELRRGAFTGDLRREFGQTKLRMDNMVRELFGQDTEDQIAKQMAQAWSEASEGLRERFNAAGGAVPKLEGWGLPQGHDADAIRMFGRRAWIDYMMQDGVLDRQRTVSPLTRTPYTDAELRTALGVVWDRITTDGWIDRDVSASAASGKGALYTQHMDHRFLHFANADAWLTYAKKFGSSGGDSFSAMVGHINVMARDIAHMEVFGPNPNRTREHIKQELLKQASNLMSNERVIEEQVADLKALQGRLSKPDPEYAAKSDRMGQVMLELDDIRGLSAFKRASQKHKKRMTALQAELDQLMNDLGRFAESPASMNRIGAHIDRVRNLRQILSEEAADSPSAKEALRSLPDDDAEPQAWVDWARGTSISNTVARRLMDEIAADMSKPGAGKKSSVVVDEAVSLEIRQLLDEMRAPYQIVSGRSPDRVMAYMNRKVGRADAMWAAMRGQKPDDIAFANGMASVRNILTAASLGSAAISALSDVAFSQDTRMRMGMGAVKSNFVRGLVLNLKEITTMGNRDDAVAAGLGLDAAINVLHRGAREFKGWDHRFWTSYAVDRVLTTSMLTPWTQAGKHLFGMDVMRFMAKLASTDFGQLPESTRKALETHGLGPREWEQIRIARKHKGLFLRPVDVIALDREVGERYLQMILRETRYAIPEGTVRSRSMMNPSAPGTLWGEMQRSAGQFKSFGFAVLMLHTSRIAREIIGREGTTGVAMAASLLITGAFLGAATMALKDIKDGRDPRKWLDEKTYLDGAHWGAAMLQAGGLGIYGDFLFADTSRFGNSLSGTLAGPLVGKAELVLGATVGNAWKLAHGKDINAGRDITRMLRSGTVPGANHWAISLIYQRTVMDSLQRMIDPDAEKSFRRANMRRLREYNQEHWWRQGQTSADRLPDLGRILATR